MAEIYKLKKGTRTLGWRWLGEGSSLSSTSNMAYYEYNYGNPMVQFFDEHKLEFQNGTGTPLPESPENLISFYENDPYFAGYLENELWPNALGRNYIVEGDVLVFLTFDPLYTHVFKYVDLSTVFDTTYKGSPVYKITKNGNTIFHKEYAGGTPVSIDYSTRTFTSINWRVYNRDRSFNTDIYIDSKVTSAPTQASFYNDGVIDSLDLKSNLRRGQNIPTNSSTVWTQTGLSFDTSYYSRAVIDVPGKAIKDGTGVYSTKTLAGIQAEFVSSSKNSITFRVYNYSRTSYINSVQYGRTSSYGSTSDAYITAGSISHFTLSGLSAGTSYTIYIKGIRENNTTVTTTLPSVSTQAAFVVSPPVWLTPPSNNMCTPRISVRNNNSFSVDVYADGTRNPTQYVGTLGAGQSGQFFVPPDRPSGVGAIINVRFLDTSTNTYSSRTNGTVQISQVCMNMMM